MASTDWVIGLTGPNAAGKGEVADYLRDRGYSVHSLSDAVRDEARRRGLRPDRRHLIRIGNEMRREGGPGILAERVLEKLAGPSVVDSIRNPAEVELLRRLPRFLLLGVTATTETRFRRCLARRRPGDPTTLEEFEDRERQENAGDPARQQLEATFALADVIVDNSGTVGALHRRIERMLAEKGVPIGEML